jgi:hypothetical protein
MIWVIRRQTCCASGTSARLLENGLIPKLGVFDATQDFKRHLKQAIKGHYETSSAHQRKHKQHKQKKEVPKGRRKLHFE